MSKAPNTSDDVALTGGFSPAKLPARPIPAAQAEDLDALIAAAELRVIDGDARVLRHGAQIRQRLASHGTQARLGALAVAGVAAVVALARVRQRARNNAAAPDGNPRQAQAPASRPSAWLLWLPVILQFATTGAVSPARPPGLAGWVSTLLSVRKRWVARRAAADATAPAGAAKRATY